MKNTMCLALVILAVLPASAQKAASPNCSANGESGLALAQDYAARVDGLLREIHASLQNISERMEAGRLTPEHARKLKLAATRDTISRLDAIAAIFDARLDLNDKGCTGTDSVVGNATAGDSPVPATANANGTVSVEQLKLEGVAAVVAQRSEEGTR